jgi:hypothetical protein
MLQNPKVSLLVVDQQDTGRYLEIHDEAELNVEGAVAHLDEFTRQYTPHPRYYGYVFLVERQQREARVNCRIRATRVALDAIHR